MYYYKVLCTTKPWNSLFDPTCQLAWALGKFWAVTPTSFTHVLQITSHPYSTQLLFTHFFSSSLFMTSIRRKLDKHATFFLLLLEERKWFIDIILFHLFSFLWKDVIEGACVTGWKFYATYLASTASKSLAHPKSIFKFTSDNWFRLHALFRRTWTTPD